MNQISIQRAPCASCPYRKDVPSGIWASEEYDKLTPYDNETMFQPAKVFMCHQANGCLCRGWLDTHGDELLGIRIAVARGELDMGELAKALDEEPAVKVFESAAEAAKHGRKAIKRPCVKAKRMAKQIERKVTQMRIGSRVSIGKMNDERLWVVPEGAQVGTVIGIAKGCDADGYDTIEGVTVRWDDGQIHELDLAEVESADSKHGAPIRTPVVTHPRQWRVMATSFADWKHGRQNSTLFDDLITAERSNDLHRLRLPHSENPQVARPV